MIHTALKRFQEADEPKGREITEPHIGREGCNTR